MVMYEWILFQNLNKISIVEIKSLEFIALKIFYVIEIRNFIVHMHIYRDRESDL